MSSTWVHGNAVRPQMVGAPFMGQVNDVMWDGQTQGNIGWSDVLGLPQGPWMRYHMQSGDTAPKVWFHFPIPAQTGATLTRVNALWTAEPGIELTSVFAFDGHVALGVNLPVPVGIGSNGDLIPGVTSFLLLENHVMQFGVGVSLMFVIRQSGQLHFFGAGADFQ